MSLLQIDPKKLVIQSTKLWDNQWLLLTTGDFAERKFNTMTVGWGSFGVMWSRPFAQVVVRPTRYTFEFMNKYDTFTLTAFPEKHRKALQLLGSQSGRDLDKITKAGLTPIASAKIPSPAFREAELIIECQKIYWDDFKPANFLLPEIEKKYPEQDYHRIYFGEILAIQGIDIYRF